MGVKLLGKIKIYDIAKKLGLTSKEVLDIAKKLNIEAKSHLSGVEEDEAKKIESELSNKSEKGNSNKAKSEEKTSKKGKYKIITTYKKQKNTNTLTVK